MHVDIKQNVPCKHFSFPSFFFFFLIMLFNMRPLVSSLFVYETAQWPGHPSYASISCKHFLPLSLSLSSLYNIIFLFCCV